MWRDLKLGYVPYSPTLQAPGDRRRFVRWAETQSIKFEIADPKRTYDVVVLSERADLSVWSRYRKGRVIYDLIDSYLAITRSDWRGQLRGMGKFVTRKSRYPQLDYWSAVRGMCESADAVICTTTEQRQDILPYCENVHVILDCHSTVIKQKKYNYVAHRPFRLVWEGLPQNLKALRELKDVLARISAVYPIELNVVTNLEYYRYLGCFGYGSAETELRKIFNSFALHDWNESTCASIICDCDLAVIPLNISDPFARGKPENKLLLLWRMGIPAIVSATPAYSSAMALAGLDMACRTPEHWERLLRHYIDYEDARRAAGERGCLVAESLFGEDEMLRRWDRVFATVFEI
jgi:hypothetical protein